MSFGEIEVDTTATTGVALGLTSQVPVGTTPVYESVMRIRSRPSVGAEGAVKTAKVREKNMESSKNKEEKVTSPVEEKSVRQVDSGLVAPSQPKEIPLSTRAEEQKKGVPKPVEEDIVDIIADGQQAMGSVAVVGGGELDV
jgi:hypothetical protein